MDEVNYLQRAVELQSEMSEMTMGEEKKHHIREMESIYKRMLEALRIVDPARAAALEKGKGGPEKKTQTADGAKSSDDKEKERLDAMAQTWYKESPKHSFENVSGMADLKVKLKDCVTNTGCEKLLDYLKIPRLNSYFFVGPPGCGKTYIIEAFANELIHNEGKEYKYLSLVGSDIISRYVGDGEKIVTRLFEEAENCAPCIVFIDEIDGVCRNRSQKSIPEYAASLTTSFLTGYNRIKSSGKSIIFIGATNYPQRVDSAMLDRAEVIRVPLPDREARTNAFRMQFEKIMPLQDGFTYDDMGARTDGYNYRDIERVCTIIKKNIFEAIREETTDQDKAIEMLKNGEFELELKDFEEAQSTFTPSSKKDILDAIDQWEKTLNDETLPPDEE